MVSKEFAPATSGEMLKEEFLAGSGLSQNSADDLADAVALCHSMCGGPHMATNLSIDPDLIDQALKLSGERTKKAAVTKALQEFIARRRQKRLLDLVGKLEWDSSYDYKAERKRA
jgi:Arc/MetJ family transcription regulator